MSQLPYVVGNWKMNGTRAMLAEARAIDSGAAGVRGVEVALAPPATLVAALREAVSTVGVGGQDCHPNPKGAHTGDVSAAMLADAGADFVIVGHSERRRDHGETSELVRAKAEAALAAELGVIVCVGETQEERDAGQAESIVERQVDASLPRGSGEGGSLPGKVSVAYEPVWAIGTGRVAGVEDVIAMHRVIRRRLDAIYGPAGGQVRILYGGSVTAGNAAGLLGADDVGGALVGGASLTAEAFLPIVNAAAESVEGQPSALA